MNVTKFAQSAALIETNGKRILIDPGTLSTEEEKAKWTNINFVFVTHKHSDHFDQAYFNKTNTDNIKFYSTSEVANTFSETNFEIIKEEDIINLGEIKVEVVKAVHGYTPFLTTNNAEINENVGYIFEIEGKRIYFTSDSISFKNDYKCDILFVPVCNHGLVMGSFDAALFAKETGATTVIPIHYDNPKYPADIPKVKEEFDKAGLNYKFLEAGEKLEL